MEIKSRQVDRFLAHPADVAAVLVFGPDQGLVRERAEAAAKAIVPDLSDPFRVSDLAEDVLSADPARLWDEAAALSMLGGRRVVRVRTAGNALAKIFERFLAEPAGDALVVVESGDLAKSASLRRLFEAADNGASIACYGDSPRDLDDVVRAALASESLGIEADALAGAVSRLGADRGVTRRELEKLALYAAGEKTVTLAHVNAAMGDESELRMDEVCDAAGAGDFMRLDTALARLWEAGTSPVAILRLALSHFQRLLFVRGESDSGQDAASVMRKLRPPVHFQRASAFGAQVSHWSQARLREALNLLYEAEALVKTTGVPGDAVCGRALLSVAALARGRG